tara:strand:- start:3825 stop:4856 length:1032 start_codon:yes stop_codon:yes gene_type:complete
LVGWTEINKARFLPAGCVHVSDAFETLGKAVFSRPEIHPVNQWTGNEADFREWGERPARAREVFAQHDVIIDRQKYEQNKAKIAALLDVNLSMHPIPFTADEWCRAIDRWEKWETERAGNTHRRNEIFNFMQRLGSAGGLDFVRIEAATGDPWTVKKTRWNCDHQHAADRFRYAALNTNMKWLMGGTIRPWERDSYLRSFDEPFFVGSRSLAFMLKVIEERWPGAVATVAAGGDFADMFMAEALRELDDIEAERVSVAPRHVSSSEDDAPVSARPKQFVTKDQTEQWYRDRKAEADRHGKKYSRMKDEVDGKAAGIPRERVRQLRRELAPEWGDPGRPNKLGG